uniref:Uncharacterized protein n=1 Tax=Romanomermis culicivorax TaxID=13658 RepID=A0A915ICG3_ROMCU
MIPGRMKKNSTVQTLYKLLNLYYEGELNDEHLTSPQRDYEQLIDDCCKTEGVTETLPTKEHETKFLRDVERELNKFKRENPSVQLY